MEIKREQSVEEHPLTYYFMQAATAALLLGERKGEMLNIQHVFVLSYLALDPQTQNFHNKNNIVT